MCIRDRYKELKGQMGTVKHFGMTKTNTPVPNLPVSYTHLIKQMEEFLLDILGWDRSEATWLLRLFTRFNSNGDSFPIMQMCIRDRVFDLVAVTEDSSTELASEELKEETLDLDITNFEELDKLPF